jgi:hypothetical protein
VEPSLVPQALVIAGTFRSGKSTLLSMVLPGMLAAAHAAHWPRTRRRPVSFQTQLHIEWDAQSAALALHRALAYFGRDICVPFGSPGEQTPAAALSALPRNLRLFAERIHEFGGELAADGWPSRLLPAQGSMHTFQRLRAPAVCLRYARCSACAPVVSRWVGSAA